MAVRWETKRPNEVRDYRHDWSLFLDGDTIATSDVTVSGITLDSDTNDDTSITVWLSGGTDGNLATVTNTITTAAGRTETEVFTRYVRSVPEPVSLATAKAQLRVLDDSEDALICGYIRAAREWVENYTGHILVRRSISQAFNGFSSYLELYHRPVIDVGSIAYVDADGADQTLADFAVTTGRYPFRVYPDEQPSIEDNSSVIVTYEAGYAEGDEPQALIQATLLLIGHWYGNREAVTERSINEVPFAVRSLCDQYRTPVI
jgi:uncharacterized phiE125 gp8 family phage protein